jgi:hypothetical protein
MSYEIIGCPEGFQCWEDDDWSWVDENGVRHIDGLWLDCLEQSIREQVAYARARRRPEAAMILNKVAATVDLVPFESMIEYAKAFDLDDGDWDMFDRAGGIETVLCRDIVNVNFADATEFVAEFLRRVRA